MLGAGVTFCTAGADRCDGIDDRASERDQRCMLLALHSWLSERWCRDMGIPLLE